MRIDEIIEREKSRSFVRKASFVWCSLEKHLILDVSSATFVGRHLIATGSHEGDLPDSRVRGSGHYFCDLYPDDPMELAFDSCELVRNEDNVVTLSFGIVPKTLKPPPGLDN